MARARRVIAIDTETELFKPGDMVPRLVSFAWAHESHPRGVLLHHTETYATFRYLLADPNVLLVGQFIAYDMAVLMRAFPDLTQDIFRAYDADRISDTKIREQLLSIREGSFPTHPGFSLADLVKRRLGFDLSKGEDTYRLRYGELRDTPVTEWPDAAREYASLDPDVTLRVWQHQQACAPIVDEENQTRASFWLHLCATHGLWLDTDRRDAYLKGLADEETALLVRLHKVGFVRKDGTRDTKAVKARMLEVGSKAKTAKGNIKIDADSCAATGDISLINYGRLGEVRSALKGHGKLIATCPVHTRYDLAVTGRTTSAPNLQNLPRKGGLRECFAPRPGYVFAGADYDQLELRTWAQVCITKFGKSEMAKVLNTGADPHSALAADIGGDRQAAKGLNFGLPGGMGINRLRAHLKSYGVDVTLDKAQKLKQAWERRWPEQRKFFQLCDTPGNLVHVGSGRVRGGDIPYTEFCNAWFQGLGADAAKRAGWLVTRACWAEPESPLFGSRIVLFAHDEFLVEVPENGSESTAAHELARLMCVGADEFLPDVPAKTKPVLMRHYSKNAKPVFDNDGRLVPWES